MSAANELRYYDALKRIAAYMTPQQIERAAKDSGISAEEYLEMSYENVLSEAKSATKGRRRPSRSDESPARKAGAP